MPSYNTNVFSRPRLLVGGTIAEDVGSARRKSSMKEPSAIEQRLIISANFIRKH